ncbi:MAG: tetratricopeptide repeat protein [Candidatus Rokubacteria bacterium]|nr:tetratricopeptide repeat protein [Candidatus Rokubacteria bacterium]
MHLPRRLQRRALLSAVSAVLVMAGVAPAFAQGASKPRGILVLPFATIDVSRDEQWVGEGIAQSLLLGLVHTPAFVLIDRQRLRNVPAPDAWDEPAAQAAAKAVKADVVLYGEVRRVGGELSLHPRYLEAKGDRLERGALDVLPVTETGLMDRLRTLPAAYVRALKVSVSDADAARMQKSAAPTPQLRAYEAYVRGRAASYRNTQEGNEAAVDLLARAIELDAQFVAAQYALGTVHQSLGNRWKAAAQFRAATQLDPSFPESYKALGDLFLTAPRRLFDQAIEAYVKALEIRPYFADAHVGLGDAKAAKGDVDGAVAAYQKALQYNPMNPKVHVSLGKIYFSEKGLYYESVNSYKRAVDLDPMFLEARMGLGEVYEDKGLYPEAIAEYKRVVELDARNTGALYNLALVYEKVDIKESISLWERYIQLAGSLPAEKDWVDVARLHLRKLRNQLDKEKKTE